MNTSVSSGVQVVSTDARADAGKLLLRVMVGGLMLFHGTEKLMHGIQGIMGLMGRIGLPGFVAYGVHIGEVLCPILIILGIWTRPAALVYAGTIVFATLLVHPGDYVRLTHEGGWGAELWIFYIVSALVVALLGAGRYSVRGGSGQWD